MKKCTKLVIILLVVLFLITVRYYSFVGNSEVYDMFDLQNKFLYLSDTEGVSITLADEFSMLPLYENGLWLIHNDGSNLIINDNDDCKGVIYDSENKRTIYICSNTISVDLSFIQNELALYIEEKSEYNSIIPSYLSNDDNKIAVFVMQFYDDKLNLVGRSKTILSATLEKKEVQYEGSSPDMWAFSQTTKVALYTGAINYVDVSIAALESSYIIWSYSPSSSRSRGNIRHSFATDTVLNEITCDLGGYYLTSSSSLRNEELYWKLNKRVLRFNNTVSFNGVALLLADDNSLVCSINIIIDGVGLKSEKGSINIEF